MSEAGRRQGGPPRPGFHELEAVHEAPPAQELRVLSADSGQALGAAYLKIESLSKRFGHFEALRDISFEIAEREFVCFLGPSGCGKTTLLRVIAGLDLQSSGRIEQAGVDISALPPTERDFGIVFQSYALFPNLSVARNIAYGLENRGIAKREVKRRVGELLDLVGMPEQIDKYPAQLSGGQQQRVALARAIATSPGMLLLDEPLSALDAKVRVHLRHEVRQLQRRLGITTVMVTHDQEEALSMADRIVVMDQGVIEQVGTPEEVYREPATVFVADFIGTMNFLPGTLIDSQRVRVGSLQLACRASPVRTGGEVTVAFRPEDVIVAAGEEDTANSYLARFDALEFLGSFVRAEVTLEEAQSQRLSAELSANVVRQLRLGPGDRHRVIIPPERIRTYSGHPARS